MTSPASRPEVLPAGLLPFAGQPMALLPGAEGGLLAVIPTPAGTLLALLGPRGACLAAGVFLPGDLDGIAGLLAAARPAPVTLRGSHRGWRGYALDLVPGDEGRCEVLLLGPRGGRRGRIVLDRAEVAALAALTRAAVRAG